MIINKKDFEAKYDLKIDIRNTTVLYLCYQCRRQFYLDNEVSPSTLTKVKMSDGGIMVICPSCDFNNL